MQVVSSSDTPCRSNSLTTFASQRFHCAHTAFAKKQFAPSMGAKLVKLSRLPIDLNGMEYLSDQYRMHYISV